MGRSNETAWYLDTFENPTLLFKAEPVRREREVSNETGGMGGDLDQDLRGEVSGVGHPDTPLLRRGLKRVLRPFL